ncbi:MAG TPA: hypothetical protein VEU51_08030 [Candidatus Acidoferrales bacterium]|nr:hypothetical protein [Candidatus Acidoferrales bacterium]
MGADSKCVAGIAKSFALACILIAVSTAMAADATPAPEAKAPKPGVFTNPELVTILGYGSDSMEPFLSRDGSILFFNNSNSSPDTNLFWAERVDDLTFQFEGEIAGVDSSALDGVASMDNANNFYFVSTRSYPITLSTIYRGVFSAGTVTGVALAPGVSRMKAGIVNFDADISADGNTLYFVDGVFAGGSVPQSTHLVIARRVGDGFVRDPKSDKLLHTLNKPGLNYAVTTSASELEIFFTHFDGISPAIYTASRKSTSKPFGKAMKIAAIAGFVEAPTISPDGRSLYYHKDDGGVFHIYRVTRP